MSDLRTIISDDDGDGIYDDIHVVNVMEESSSPEPVVVHHSPKRDTTYSTKSLLSGKTKLKIAIAVAIFFAVFAIVFFIAIAIIGLIV